MPADDGPGGRERDGVELFEQAARESRREAAPLAERMRPRSLDEFVGQAHLLGPGRLLRVADRVGRPPLDDPLGPAGHREDDARLPARRRTRRRTSPRSPRCSPASRRSRGLVAEAEERLTLHGQRTILFVDEIHRFNKAQQDAFLPHVERGTVTLIGATTENPSFEVISALLSRCRVYVLEPLTETDLETIVRRALADPERGLGRLGLELDPRRRGGDRRRSSEGDARTALNILEVAARLLGATRRERGAPPRSPPSRSARRRSGRRSSTTRRARSTTT